MFKLIKVQVVFFLILITFSCNPFSLLEQILIEPEPEEEELVSTQKVQTIISNSKLELFKSNGLSIYKGDNPPTIYGAYLADDLDCTSSTDGVYLQDLVYYYNFYGQTSDFDISLDYTNQSGDTASGRGAFISGDGNNFSIYMEAHGTSGSATYTTVSIYSGTLTSYGITNFQFGFIMVEKYDPYDSLMEVNNLRVYDEGDYYVDKAIYPYY